LLGKIQSFLARHIVRAEIDTGLPLEAVLTQ
jgi:hypothetical protein